jgi:hypothetical protein
MDPAIPFKIRDATNKPEVNSVLDMGKEFSGNVSANCILHPHCASEKRTCILRFRRKLYDR